jgi:hypothetical protein
LKQSAPGQQLTAADQKITNRDYRLIGHNVQHALDNIMMGDIELFVYRALLCQYLHNYNYNVRVVAVEIEELILMQSRRNRRADYIRYTLKMS